MSAAIEKEYGATALNIAMQDGRDAGQSVPHVHFHILPRAPADFSNNDDIYDAIESFDADPATAAGAPEENKAPPNARSKLNVPRDEDRCVRWFDPTAMMMPGALAHRAPWHGPERCRRRSCSICMHAEIYACMRVCLHA